ncbi:hypothetical protein EDEG_01627 [Edhazardia aedis USNM 41457]|uniref:Uncharacterized protein n=1 Tax=Edhazardia aedis (strain USNM 41457) TaxID=1003232 RepID=J9DNJ8_EDHAE|nr:hypothetical protein EDEG_01627 [Edhazardia aedis USNM 41457]|eukprot:EJW04105.1 hypothetical protein EDEG_01627 [Edhazardia aedis USNM 41457]
MNGLYITLIFQIMFQVCFATNNRSMDFVEILNSSLFEHFNNSVNKNIHLYIGYMKFSTLKSLLEDVSPDDFNEFGELISRHNESASMILLILKLNQFLEDANYSILWDEFQIFLNDAVNHLEYLKSIFLVSRSYSDYKNSKNLCDAKVDFDKKIDQFLTKFASNLKCYDILFKLALRKFFAGDYEVFDFSNISNCKVITVGKIIDLKITFIDFLRIYQKLI